MTCQWSILYSVCSYNLLLAPLASLASPPPNYSCLLSPLPPLPQCIGRHGRLLNRHRRESLTTAHKLKQMACPLFLPTSCNASFGPRLQVSRTHLPDRVFCHEIRCVPWSVDAGAAHANLLLVSFCSVRRVSGFFSLSLLLSWFFTTFIHSTIASHH